MRKNSFKFLMNCVICTCVFLGMPAQAKLYKWKDENGQIHYGDKVPARYLKGERKELNEQGAVLKTIDRAKTPEEREEQRRLDAIAKQEALKVKEKRKQDRVLLDTYTTERDLIIALDARIDAVNSQIQLSESIIESAKHKLERTENRIEQIKMRNREVPKDVYAKLKREQQQLDTHRKVADGHKLKRESIKKQFNGYIARFNELMLIKQKRRKAAEERRKAEAAVY